MAKIYCTADERLLIPLRPCMTDDTRLKEISRYAVIDPFADPDGFPYCCISKNAVVYSCGAIARRGDWVSHDHPAGEIDLCRRLASAASNLMDGVTADIGSEGTPAGGTDYFLPFFRAAGAKAPVPPRITPEFVLTIFGGTLAPGCEIETEELSETSAWWQRTAQSYSSLNTDRRDALFVRWRAMVEWFTRRPSFQSTAFISIRERCGGGGGVFPTLILGMTPAGSVAGIWGNGVHT